MPTDSHTRTWTRARTWRTLARSSGAAIALLTLTFVGSDIAEACGGFFRSKTLSPEQQPSLSREKVLLIHDAEAGQQHFIREVAFQRASEPFGFVVPTPTRPTVAAVETTPFSKLRAAFPFNPPSRGRGGSKGAGFGGAPGGGVQILEVKKVGSFTAFVLSATDSGALAQWLADNDLIATEEADAWLEHYVRMGFFYVAMRYDPPSADLADGSAPGPAAVVAETMRISFATPIPYYPYLEPEAPAGSTLGPDPRLMELWYVGRDPVVPVALQTTGDAGGAGRWVRPLETGEQRASARAGVEAALDPELRKLLPEGPLVLQTFQDQKRSRAGFQDILFASKEGRELSAEQRAALEPLLGILDPALRPKPAAGEQAEVGQ